MPRPECEALDPVPNRRDFSMISPARVGIFTLAHKTEPDTAAISYLKVIEADPPGVERLRNRSRRVKAAMEPGRLPARWRVIERSESFEIQDAVGHKIA